MSDTWLPYADYLELLDADHARIAGLAAPHAAAPVPTCPGWSMHDLLRHLAAVYQRSAQIVRTGQEAPRREPEAGDAGPLFAAAYGELRAALADGDPVAPCWTWSPDDRTVSFWARRMAHETAVHRVDAELAAGEVTSVPVRASVDGLSEILDLWIPQRAAQRGGAVYEPVLVRTGEHAWRVSLDADALRAEPGPGPAATTVSGEPSELFLFLWGRRPAEAVRIDGDPAAVHELRRRLGAAQ